MRTKPAGFEFQKAQFLTNLSQITRPTKSRVVEAEKSIAILENILRKVVGEYKVEPPSFLKENSAELSVIINGVDRLSTVLSKNNKQHTNNHNIKNYNNYGKQVLNVDFGKKAEPQLIIRGLETTLKNAPKYAYKDDEASKKNYKISSNRGNSNNGSTEGIPKSSRFDPDILKLAKKSSDSKHESLPKKGSAYKKTTSSKGTGGSTELKLTINLKSRHNENQLLTSSNLLNLVKKTSISGTKIPLANSTHNGSQATVNSNSHLKSQLIAKIIKNPFESMPQRDSNKNSSVESAHRDFMNTFKNSKVSNKKHSKNPSIEKLVLNAHNNLRMSELNIADQVRSASRHYVKAGQGTKTKQRPREAEQCHTDQSSLGNRHKPKTTTRIHHAKNLSEFNITSRNLTKDSSDSRKNPHHLRGTLGTSVKL